MFQKVRIFAPPCGQQWVWSLQQVASLYGQQPTPCRKRDDDYEDFYDPCWLQKNKKQFGKKNTSEYSEHKWIKTGTSPLGSLQQVWSSLHENDGSWGHLWLPLGKNNDSLFLHLYFKLVAASGQKRISLLCKLVAYCSQGKKILVMYTHFSLPEILASSSWAYIVHTSRERKSKEQRSLIFCWSPKSRRVCVDMWVTDLILN